MPANRKALQVKDGVFLTRLVMVVAVAEPLMTLPQIIQIWGTKQAGDVSLTTWAFYVFASAVWLVYGAKLRNKALLVTSVLWIVMETAVVFGVILWGHA